MRQPLGQVVSVPVAVDATPRAGRQVFSGEVWLGGRRRRLEAWWQGERAWLEIEDGGAWALDRRRRVAEHRPGAPPLADDAHAELALGPPLLLLLATRGVFALHAGAAEIAGRLCLFLGPSGSGKSTLAASGGMSPWRRLADDLVPVTLDGSSLVARLDFPQLKLSPSLQRLADGEPRPVDALFLLAGPGSAAEPEVTPLSELHVATAVLGHTVASRLFDQKLLAAHFELASAAALPAWRLATPRDFAFLPALSRKVEEAVLGLA
ncbi:MAG TPA: hypothetical protein VF017_17205 [Thermoanaerobaculia bacterium]|nr:hypothetical protein [Thermoanaerobaculia bacterium]